MGCGTSRGDGDDVGYLGDRPITVPKIRGTGTMDDNTLVRELFDEDVHDVYEFTGPILGTGAFATVLRVRDRMSGVEYAVKQVDLKGIKDDAKTMSMLYNEIKGMKMLSHPNIVRLQEVYQLKDEDMLYLVLDRLEGGSVQSLLKQEGRIDEGHAAYIMAQVVDAVRYCHSLGIAHRDLKLANCMFEDTSPAPIVKIIDFGLCAELKDGKTSTAFVGTMTYAAPEMIKPGNRHGIECDMWSVGVMTYALVSGRPPFDCDDEATLQHKIKYSALSYTDKVWQDVSALCRDFVDKCLNKNPKKRTTAKQAQRHPWIKKAVRSMEGAPLSKGAMLAMVKFQETNLFEKIAMELVAYSYEPSQIKDLERHFREIDTNGTGVIYLSEFKTAIMARRKSIVRAQLAKKAAAEAEAEVEEAKNREKNEHHGEQSRESKPQDKEALSSSTGEQPGEDAGLTVALAEGATERSEEQEKTAAAVMGVTGGDGEGLGLGGGEVSGGPAEAEDEGRSVGVRGKGDAAEVVDLSTGAGEAEVVVEGQGVEERSKGEGHNTIPTRNGPSLSMGEVGHLVRKLSSRALGRSREGGGGGEGRAGDAASSSSTTMLPPAAGGGADTTGPSHNTKEYRRMTSSGSVGASVVGNLDEEGVEKIFEAMDVNGSGTIDITEFVAACLVKRQVNEAAIKAAFHRLDYSRKGLIGAHDMRMYLGDSYDEKQMESYMRQISSREDGLVTFEDFSRCLKAHGINSRFSSRGSSRRPSIDSMGRPTFSFEGNRPDFSSPPEEDGDGPADNDRPKETDHSNDNDHYHNLENDQSKEIDQLEDTDRPVVAAAATSPAGDKPSIDSSVVIAAGSEIPSSVKKTSSDGEEELKPEAAVDSVDAAAKMEGEAQSSAVIVDFDSTRNAPTLASPPPVPTSGDAVVL